MQPTPYTRQTGFSEAERSNVGGRSTVSTSGVDAELDAIALTLAGVLLNLGILQRDDGRLRDGFVELFNLSPAARAALATKWSPRGLWAPLTAYGVGDMVDVAGSAYVCAIAHTSSIFAADYALGRWQVFVPLTSSAGLQFTPTATVLSTNVQDAIAEVDTKARRAINPQLAYFYGGL